MTTTLRSSLQVLLLAAAGSIFFCQSASAFSSAAPTARTGAPPGGATCASCHAGAPGAGSVNISVTGGNEYSPGEMIELMVTVEDPTKMRWGFSMVARDTDNNLVDVGSWIASGSNTGVNGSHVGHVSAPSAPGIFTFTIDWTPPATGVGDVTFYAVGNAANGNGSTSGDSIYFTNLTISEAVATPTPATLTALFREPDGTGKFTLTGGAGETYTIEHSENLENWSFLEERTLVSPSEEITDSGAIGQDRRFYRATPGVIPQ